MVSFDTTSVPPPPGDVDEIDGHNEVKLSFYTHFQQTFQEDCKSVTFRTLLLRKLDKKFVNAINFTEAQFYLTTSRH